MKTLTGKINNFEKKVIGKLTTKKKLFGHKKKMIYLSKGDDLPKGYLAIISSNKEYDNNFMNVISEVENINELHDDDIVEIDTNGKISILYDVNSSSNTLFITERCNSNCIMCPQPPISYDDKLFNDNLTFISLLPKETKKLLITGGEPTLIGDKLFILISAINQKIPKASITLLSNGINFSKLEYAKRLSQVIKKQDIVVDIPLHSDIDTIHNQIARVNSFYKTLNGIYNLAKYNVRIGIRVVVHKLNYNRLPELSEYIYSNFPFVYQVAFVQIEPIGFSKDNLADLWIDPYDYNDKLEEAVMNLHNRNLQVTIFNSQLCVLPKNLRRFAVQSISDWKNIYIDECVNCILKTECAGFFSASKDIHSNKIKAIQK